LIGGGLIRSQGGWANVKAMRRAKIFEKADERILGDGDFVLCYWANRELEVSMSELSRRLKVSVMAISNAVLRGEKIVKEFDKWSFCPISVSIGAFVCAT